MVGGQASGGAISDYGCDLTISRCTFVDNQVTTFHPFAFDGVTVPGSEYFGETPLLKSSSHVFRFKYTSAGTRSGTPSPLKSPLLQFG